jgi:hypothetical protein
LFQDFAGLMWNWDRTSKQNVQARANHAFVTGNPAAKRDS